MTPMPDPVPFPGRGRGRVDPNDIYASPRHAPRVGPGDEDDDQEDEDEGESEDTFVRRGDRAIETPVPQGDPSVDVDALVKQIDEALAKKKGIFGNKKAEAAIRGLLEQSRGVLAGAEAVVKDLEIKYQDALERASKAERNATSAGESFAIARTHHESALERVGDHSKLVSAQLGKVGQSFHARDEAMSKHHLLRSQIVSVARVLGAPLDKCDEENAIVWLLENAERFKEAKEIGAPPERAGAAADKLARISLLTEVEQEIASLGEGAPPALLELAARWRGSTGLPPAAVRAPLTGKEKVDVLVDERRACAKLIDGRIDKIIIDQGVPRADLEPDAARVVTLLEEVRDEIVGRGLTG